MASFLLWAAAIFFGVVALFIVGMSEWEAGTDSRPADPRMFAAATIALGIALLMAHAA